MTKTFEPDLSRRVESLPPYLFAEIERKVAAKRAAGVDIISLGIGDPDSPTPAHVLAAMDEGVRDPANHQYPTNRGTPEFRAAVAGYYQRRFGVDARPGDRDRAAPGRQRGHRPHLLRPAERG